MATGVWDSRDRCRGTQRQHLSGQSFLNLWLWHTWRLVVMTQILGLWSTAPCREITCQRASEECIIEVVPKLPPASAYHETTKSDISKCQGNSQWCVCIWANIQPRQKHSNVNMEVLERGKKWGVWRNKSALFLRYLIAHIPLCESFFTDNTQYMKVIPEWKYTLSPASNRETDHLP